MSNEYDIQAICTELTDTAHGTGYYGNALYVANGMNVSEADHAMLNNWMGGMATWENATDAQALLNFSARLSNGTAILPESNINDGTSFTIDYALHHYKLYSYDADNNRQTHAIIQSHIGLPDMVSLGSKKPKLTNALMEGIIAMVTNADLSLPHTNPTWYSLAPTVEDDSQKDALPHFMNDTELFSIIHDDITNML